MTDVTTQEDDVSSRQATGSSHALIVAAGIFLSRIAGLVRERVFAHYLGTSLAAGAFKAALRIPNYLQNLFGEGVLSASFIPVYSRLIAEKDEELAGRVAGAVGAILAVFVSITVLVSVLFTPLFVDVIATGFKGELRELTITIVRILFPGVGLLVMSAWCLGILNSHRKFFIPYVAPVLWNAAMIATMLIFGSRVAPAPLSVLLAWGMVAGSLLQFAIQLPFVFRYAPKIRFALNTKLDAVRSIFRRAGPVVVGRGVLQFNAYIDEWIASFLGGAAVASISYSQTIYLLPISLFGMAVAAAELPHMSSVRGSIEETHAAVRARIEAGQRQIAFFIVPTTMAFIFLGDFLVGALYQTGRFGANDTRYVWYILAGSGIGLFAATEARLCASAFYALNDTKTPLWFALLHVALTASLGLLFAFPLRPLVISFISDVLGMPLPVLAEGTIALGAVALTAAASLAAWTEYLLLRRTLGRRIGAISWTAPYLAKVIGAAALATLAAVAVARLVLPRLDIDFHPIIAALIVVGVFGVIYLGAAAAMRLPEIAAVKRRLLRRR